MPTSSRKRVYVHKWMVEASHDPLREKPSPVWFGRTQADTEDEGNPFNLSLSSVQAAELIRSTWQMKFCSGREWRREEVQRRVQEHQRLAKGEQTQGTGISAGQHQALRMPFWKRKVVCTGGRQLSQANRLLGFWAQRGKYTYQARRYRSQKESAWKHCGESCNCFLHVY